MQTWRNSPPHTETGSPLFLFVIPAKAGIQDIYISAQMPYGH